MQVLLVGVDSIAVTGRDDCLLLSPQGVPWAGGLCPFGALTLSSGVLYRAVQGLRITRVFTYSNRGLAVCASSASPLVGGSGSLQHEGSVTHARGGAGGGQSG